ncbi:hypothetical protein GCM10009555_052090 [Acrocarpospora macrocephala]|uniref:Uncharacterized protein n=1 Tax=Acrocarpospora macrocephala TaxID=150177 RepID=A0A5M3WPZ8_9ACTN|nr:hypothetical protein Amac_029270 [Acrocarpospora macrocephala]
MILAAGGVRSSDHLRALEREPAAQMLQQPGAAADTGESSGRWVCDSLWDGFLVGMCPHRLVGPRKVWQINANSRAMVGLWQIGQRMTV